MALSCRNCGLEVRHAKTGNPGRDLLVHVATDSMWCYHEEKRATLAPALMGSTEDRLKLREMQLRMAGEVIERLMDSVKNHDEEIRKRDLDIMDLRAALKVTVRERDEARDILRAITRPVLVDSLARDEHDEKERKYRRQSLRPEVREGERA